MDVKHRVVITGYGAVTAYGVGAERLWAGVCSGQPAIGPFDLFDASRQRTRLAGVVPGAALRASDSPTDSRSDTFAVAAAAEALARADLILDSETDCGVFFGSSTGGMFEGEAFYDALPTAGPAAHRVLAHHQNNAPGDAVARRFGACGPLQTTSAACAAGAMALANAWFAIQEGEVEVALAGAADGLCQLTYAGFNALRAVDDRSCRPFRADRAGLSLGEGAGVLVLETQEHARRRGVTPRAVLSGVGSSCDAHHMTAPHPEGRGAVAALEEALAGAGLTAADIDFVNAHGTGTPLNDVAEWAALSRVLGARAGRVPVTSTKGSVGHLLGAAGAVEAIATIQCLERGMVHPTPGPGAPDPEAPVDLVRFEPRPCPDARHAVSINLAFGGANGAVLLSNWEE
ncbi:MAG: beta-ketoacyl-[acyl-carrier-protein] synthase family protein [Planctomycetota bacterium]